MTYVSLQVFTECMRSTGIQDKDEYQELHNQGVLPTNLMPRSPSIYYQSPPKSRVKAGTHIKTFEKMCGRKYNNKDKNDRRLVNRIQRSQPEIKARSSAYSKEYHQRPEVIAKEKEKRARPEYREQRNLHARIYRQRLKQ